MKDGCKVQGARFQGLFDEKEMGDRDGCKGEEATGVRSAALEERHAGACLEAGKTRCRDKESAHGVRGKKGNTFWFLERGPGRC